MKFTIYDLRFTIGRKPARPAAGAVSPARCRGLQAGCLALNRQSSIVNRKSQGIALVITLIMLAITLVMAVAFLALAKRERGSVTASTDITTARLASDAALANAEAQIMANIQSGVINGGSSNALNFHVFVSTNYYTAFGFDANVNGVNPTNVNYDYQGIPGLPPLTTAMRNQNIANLWFLPRAPVFVTTNPAVAGYDFRYYLDLNENGMFDPNGMQPVVSDDPANPYYDFNGNKVTVDKFPLVLNNFFVGDPEWVGVLQHPDAPHSADNQFISRYAFIAVPVGNTLDVNFLHNQAINKTVSGTPNGVVADSFFRNQSVGSWEINLAAFLADLNTNEWNSTSPFSSLYNYQRPFGSANTGVAFEDAASLLAYRYNFNYANLLSANFVLGPFAPNTPPNIFPNDRIDAYSDGLLQTNLNFNVDATAAALDGDAHPNLPWVGSDNPNRYFTPSDFFDTSKVSSRFVNRLKGAGASPLAGLGLYPTYDRYTYYRMLDELGTDSSPDEGMVNLNYDNVDISYTNNNGVSVPYSISVAVGAETNLIPWTPQRFFLSAADQMLRSFSANWFKSNPTNYLITYYGAFPRQKVDATGLGVENFPNYGVTNEVPSFGITNIPVMINGSFIYSPAVNRILQLAANLYDATTNGNSNLPGVQLNLPHVFRPVFEHDTVGNLFIVSYEEVPFVSGPADPQLAPPTHTVEYYTNLGTAFTPITEAGRLINIYGVPWIIGAKKGLPNFNQLSMVNAVQVTRKVEITRTSADPYTATYATNQMYVMGISNNLSVSFWNSYFNAYPRPLTVVASETVHETLSLAGGAKFWSVAKNFSANVTVNSWPGSQWHGASTSGSSPAQRIPNDNSFLNFNWPFVFQNPITYDYGAADFDPSGQWKATVPQLPQLPKFDLLITNFLQAFILDGNNVIDYVQLRDPISVGGLNEALADPDYSQPNNVFLQWSTNVYEAIPPTPYGVVNQVWVSGHPASAPTAGGKWSTSPTPMGLTTPDAEAAYFNGFFVPNFQYNAQIYVNDQLVIQAPYTPSRTVFSSFLLQANDPLVHYLASDLGTQAGMLANWSGDQKWRNGIWNKVDDLASQPLPTPPATPIGGRYQPWLRKGQMDAESALTVAPVTNNYACKDPLVESSDNWDFTTNLYPSVGWIGRVHRGTPWQTVYMKDADLTKYFTVSGATTNYVGTNTWAYWTGDIQKDFGQFYDAANYAPVQDRLLFDVFTTRFNDNAVRGTLPVNQTHLAAWSAIFSGMPAIVNNTPFVYDGVAVTYTNLIINPAGPMIGTAPNQFQPTLWQIVNGPGGINATRANTNLFPYQAFTHAGDILATPALTTNFLYLGTPKSGNQHMNFGINDEMYEWLPQHMMGLVRASEPRFVLYAFGQTLHPAPGGTLLNGPYFQMVTNYQVSAETAVRAVIRIDGADTKNPHAVVESYNVLPPY